MPKNRRQRRDDRFGGKAPQDRAWNDLDRDFREHVLPSLLESAYMIQAAEAVDPDNINLYAAIELGLMLLLDKPLIVVGRPGVAIPAALRRAAALVIDDVDMAVPADQARVAAAIRVFNAQIGEVT